MSIKLKSLFKVVCYATAIVIFLYLEGRYNIIFRKNNNNDMASSRVLSAEFEVFGIVQGVFFRKNTQDAANKFGIRGWCMNTKDGTVKGVIEANEEKAFNEMKHWLSSVGSPQSRIDKTLFGQVTTLSDFSFPDFSIRRVPKK